MFFWQDYYLLEDPIFCCYCIKKYISFDNSIIKRNSVSYKTAEMLAISLYIFLRNIFFSSFCCVCFSLAGLPCH